MAEVFSADPSKGDYVYRLFDPEKFARDSVATYPPKMRAQVDAFVGGINAYIDGHQNSLEPAFRLLGIKPAHYTAEDLEAGALTYCDVTRLQRDRGVVVYQPRAEDGAE